MRLEDRHGPAPRARPEALGSARLKGPAQIPADSWVTISLVHTAGSLGVDDGGRIKVAFRTTEDFEPPQFDDATAPNYCSISSDADVTFAASYDPYGGTRPFWKAVVATVLDGSLAPGDEISITFGDGRYGSPGWRVQTFVEKRWVFLVAADPVRTGTWEVLSERLALEIVNGPPAALVALVPTEREAGNEFDVLLRVVDGWGNVVRDFDGEVTLETEGDVEGLPSSVRLTSDDAGCLRIGNVVAPLPGVIRVRARAAGLPDATSNTLIVRPRGEAGPFRPFWGDLHGQSGETIGVGTVEDYFNFARHAAGLDFASH